MREEILALVKEAMVKQDSATYHGDQSIADNAAERATEKIIKVVREERAISEASRP